MRRLLLALFAAGHRAVLWRRRRFTAAGGMALAILGIAGALSLGAAGSRLDLLILAVAALLATAVPPALLFRRRTAGIGIERRLPRTATAGIPFTYTLVLSNRGPRAVAGLLLTDRPTQRLPDAATFRLAREPAETSRTRFDRVVGFHRWLWLLDRYPTQPVEPAEAPVAVPAGATAEVQVAARPLRRGLVRFDGVEIAQPDPLGLVHGLVRRPLPQSLVVLPRTHPMPPLALAGSHRLEAGGASRAQAVGQTEEFLYLRDFRSGDSRRHVHWRSTARRGALVVKEHRDEYFQRHALVVDTFAAPDQHELFEDAVETAASAAAAARFGDSLLDLMFVGDRAYVVSAGRGLGTLETLLEVLACVAPSHDRPFQVLADLVRRHAGVLTGCLCVLLAWDEARQSLVREVRAMGVPVFVLLLVPTGGAPPAAGVLADDPAALHPVPAGAVAAALAGLRIPNGTDGSRHP